MTAVLRLRAVKLRINSEAGSLGAEVLFQDGLNIVRAPNSSGKTQILQAISFALGVESMFGPGRQFPMGSAFTDEVRIDAADPSRTSRVTSSWCAIEVENSSGERLVAQRFASHPDIKPNLVRLWRSPALTNPSARGLPPELLFVREGGAAQSPVGFHRVLEEFVGWDLPHIPRYTGGESKLYVEVLFPFLYVDQRAWGTASPRAITHYQLREPLRRSIEFLLGLEGPAAATKRAALEAEIASLRSRWSSILSSIRASAEIAGARVVGLTDAPAGSTARARGPVVPTSLDDVGVEFLEEGEWLDAEGLGSSLEAKINRPLHADKDDTVGSDDGAERLRVAEDALRRRLSTAQAVEQNVSLVEAQVAALDARLRSLREEKARYRDLGVLMRLGAEDAGHAHSLNDPDCPTCHQPLSAIEGDRLGPVLGVDDSVNLLNAEIATAEQMRSEAASAQESARSAYGALSREIDAARLEVRTLREELTAPADYPSIADLTEKMTAELRLSEIRRVEDRVAEQVATLRPLAVRVAEARAELKSLPADVPSSDLDTVNLVEQEMREQLAEFGFGSYDAQKVALSDETLRPVRPGYDIDLDVSASDVVRIKVAFLDALRKVALARQAPHPGLLVLDEPRQHEMEETSFRSTLARLAASEGQTVVTSAAPSHVLASLIVGTNAHLIEFERPVIAPEAADSPLDRTD